MRSLLLPLLVVLGTFASALGDFDTTDEFIVDQGEKGVEKQQKYLDDVNVVHFKPEIQQKHGYGQQWPFFSRGGQGQFSSYYTSPYSTFFNRNPLRFQHQSVMNEGEGGIMMSSMMPGRPHLLEHYFRTFLSWLTPIQKSELRQMKAMGAGRRELVRRASDFFVGIPVGTDRHIKAVLLLQSACEKVAAMVLGGFNKVLQLKKETMMEVGRWSPVAVHKAIEMLIQQQQQQQGMTSSNENVYGLGLFTVYNGLCRRVAEDKEQLLLNKVIEGRRLKQQIGGGDYNYNYGSGEIDESGIESGIGSNMRSQRHLLQDTTSGTTSSWPSWLLKRRLQDRIYGTSSGMDTTGISTGVDEDKDYSNSNVDEDEFTGGDYYKYKTGGRGVGGGILRRGQSGVDFGTGTGIDSGLLMSGRRQQMMGVGGWPRRNYWQKSNIENQMGVGGAYGEDKLEDSDEVGLGRSTGIDSSSTENYNYNFPYHTTSGSIYGGRRGGLFRHRGTSGIGGSGLWWL